MLHRPLCEGAGADLSLFGHDQLPCPLPTAVDGRDGIGRFDLGEAEPPEHLPHATRVVDRQDEPPSDGGQLPGKSSEVGARERTGAVVRLVPQGGSR